LVAALIRSGVEARRYFTLPAECMNGSRHSSLPVSRKAAHDIVCLPIDATMTEEDVAHVVRALAAP
jgi:dTDP-4-amino-4,6-dideoxygalactose transaminase